MGRPLPIACVLGVRVGIRAEASYLWVMKHAFKTARIASLALSLGLGLGFSLGLTPAMAEEREFNWIPAEITLPEDMEVVIDRSIGSANRILSFTTDAEVDVLADTWREALTQGPYQVKPTAEGMDRRLIEFSGGRVQNGQITFMRGADSTATTVQFDASIAD
jgi:hypothetical protein